LLSVEAYQKVYPEGRRGAGRYSLPYQAILFSDPGPDERIEFALTLFHEMIHFKFWNVLQVTDPQKRLQTYRTGIAVVSRDGRQLYLNELNEAITEDLTDEFFDTILRQHPDFAEEITKRGKAKRGYAEERVDFHRLLQTLSEADGSEYTTDELRELFIRAAATGNVLPIARIVERTLGPGSFRLLGGPPKDIDHLPGTSHRRKTSVFSRNLGRGYLLLSWS
jgi:hypothetical protein